ncbi:MAG: acyclic terpene utilization AtuA family protein, partial [Spongiibacter sp.]
MSDDKKVLIANGQGFWGDSLLGPLRLVEEGPLDYLTLDYLAEVTMSIMQKQKLRNPDAGYATDFVDMLRQILPRCKEKGIKVIANAGGVNPKGCRDAIQQVVKELGLKGVKVGIVEGDDILDQLPELMKSGESFKNLDNGDDLSTILDRISSANVYIGAKPIADALAQGADIVVTGRATDPSLVVAPLIHEFGWSLDDYDKLAAGTVMG